MTRPLRGQSKRGQANFYGKGEDVSKGIEKKEKRLSRETLVFHACVAFSEKYSSSMEVEDVAKFKVMLNDDVAITMQKIACSKILHKPVEKVSDKDISKRKGALLKINASQKALFVDLGFLKALYAEDEEIAKFELTEDKKKECREEILRTVKGDIREILEGLIGDEGKMKEWKELWEEGFSWIEDGDELRMHLAAFDTRLESLIKDSKLEGTGDVVTPLMELLMVETATPRAHNLFHVLYDVFNGDYHDGYIAFEDIISKYESTDASKVEKVRDEAARLDFRLANLCFVHSKLFPPE
jgi:hypothetical protein